MKLKPCPFCGAHPSVRASGEWWCIECTNPDCYATVKVNLLACSAEEKWNTRAEEPAEKTAHWDINTDGFYPFCSHCGEAAQRMTPHCPNCGAKMITRRHEG